MIDDKEKNDLSDSGSSNVDDIISEIFSEAGLDVTPPLSGEDNGYRQPEKKPEPVCIPEKKTNESDKDREDKTERVNDPDILVSVSQFTAGAAKKGFRTVKKKIGDSEVFKPDVLKDMFFGTKEEETELSEQELKEYEQMLKEDEEAPTLFSKNKHKRNNDPRADKMLLG